MFRTGKHGKVYHTEKKLDKHLEDIYKISAKQRGDYYDPATGKYYDWGGTTIDKITGKPTYQKINSRAETVRHCGGTSFALKKKFPNCGLTNVRGYQNIQGKSPVEHAWNRNRKGHIIDVSREQFGDKKGVHIIKPNDPRFHEYTEADSRETLYGLPDNVRIPQEKRLKRYQTRNVSRYMAGEKQPNENIGQGLHEMMK